MGKQDFYQISLKIILKNDKGEILILNGLKGGSYEGFYDLPGGRIDEDEFTVPFEEVIRREVIEEIGKIKFTIDAKPAAIGRHLLLASISKAKNDLHILLVFFEAKYLRGDIVISNEHEGYKWVDLSQNDPAKFFKSGMLDGIRMYLGVNDQ